MEQAIILLFFYFLMFSQGGTTFYKIKWYDYTQ